MELALYGPGGFYERPAGGADGDFVTSPHVHPVFGALLGRAVRDLLRGARRTGPLPVTEVGAGDGTLAAPALGALADLDVDYTAVEVSAGARAALATIDGVRVSDRARRRRARRRRERAPRQPAVPPAARRSRDPVGLDGERFVEVETPWDGEPGAADGETVVPVGAFAFIDRLAPMLERGYALLIDYGAVGSPGGDIHGYRDHRVVEDVLIDPGSSRHHGRRRLRVDRPARRGARPVRLPDRHPARRAARARVRGLASVRSSHGRPRCSTHRDGLEAVRTWSGRSRATLLVDPSALGRLRWLLLATPGLPSPSWLP